MSHFVAAVSNTERGVFVAGRVNSAAVHFLIDTGATITLVGRTVYDELADDQPALQPTKMVVKGVDGSPLDVAGMGVFTLQFGNVTIQRQLVVCQLYLLYWARTCW